MLKTKNLSLGYGDFNIVKDINLKIEEGDFLTIIGVNGSGKSTILKAISRNLKPKEGFIYLDGKLIHKADTKEVASKLAILPQNPKVPDDFTVRDLVGYGRYPYLGLTGRLTHKDIEIIDWAIEATGIENLQHRLVSTLSGGERQRAWIALALAQKTKILLLDEPTTFLDISHQFEILELVKSLNQDFGITIIMILHDINQASRYSKEIAVLKDGSVYKKGKPVDVISKQTLEDVFNIDVKIFNDEQNDCPYFITMGKKGL